MMKLRQVLMVLIAVAVTVVLSVGSNVTVNASSWHNGLPSEVRGWYHGKLLRTGSRNGHHYWLYAYVHLYKNRYASGSVQGDSNVWTKVKYKKLEVILIG